MDDLFNLNHQQEVDSPLFKLLLHYYSPPLEITIK